MTEAAVPKAYIMVMYRSSPEPTTFAQYGELAIPAVRASGGRMLARGMPAKTYEAGMNERVTLIEFDSLEQAIGSRESDDPWPAQIVPARLWPEPGTIMWQATWCPPAISNNAGDAVADMAHHVEVVRDEKIGEAEIAA